MNLINVIEENYGLSILKIEKNEESSDGNVYVIYCENVKYIVKVYDNINHVDSIIKLHKYISKYNMRVPEIIETNKNKSYVMFNDKYIVIYSFLNGIQISNYIKKKENKYDSKIVKKIANELRKFHEITLNQNFGFDEIEFANKLERKSVLHFDLTKDNIFINGEQVGFIDFDDAKYGDSVCDVAIALCFLFISKKRGLDTENIKLFLDNYYGENSDLRNAEEIHIKEYATHWIDYLLNGHEFDSSLKESFKVKKEEIKKYLNKDY